MVTTRYNDTFARSAAIAALTIIVLLTVPALTTQQSFGTAMASGPTAALATPAPIIIIATPAPPAGPDGGPGNPREPEHNDAPLIAPPTIVLPTEPPPAPPTPEPQSTPSAAAGADVASSTDPAPPASKIIHNADGSLTLPGSEDWLPKPTSQIVHNADGSLTLPGSEHVDIALQQEQAASEAYKNLPAQVVTREELNATPEPYTGPPFGGTGRRH